MAGIQGFKPRKLAEAREARGMTQKALADRLGITRAAVCQYERGQRTPSRQVLLTLSFVLGMPTHYFLQDGGYEVRNAVFFRSMTSATKIPRMQAKRRYEWLVRIVDLLRGFIEFPDVSIPAFELPADPRGIRWDEIDGIANSTRGAMGLGFGPISNVTWLIENKGGIVTSFGLDDAALDAFSNWCDGTPFFILNAQKGTAVRWRYDLAHELGHMILHRKVREDLLQDHSIFRLTEEQANCFAGAFLLPETSFSQTLPYSVTLDTLIALKSKWKVSISAMVMRLRNLDLVSEKKKQRLFMAISRRQWRTKEPLDDQLEIEEPQILRRAAELLRTHNVLGSQDIEASLGIHKDDIRTLLGYEEDAEERIIRLRPPHE